MRYWWVNHKKSWKEETGQGFLWSPFYVTRSDGGIIRNQFYDSMRSVAPGDPILSYYDAQVNQLGIARSYCYHAPRPQFSGAAAGHWDTPLGYRVDVRFEKLRRPVSPLANWQTIKGLMPDKHSPLDSVGKGRTIYLAEISIELFERICMLGGESDMPIGSVTTAVDPFGETVKQNFEEMEVSRIANERSLDESTKRTVIRARVGQGAFRTDVLKLERRCRITAIEEPSLLIASHIKAWSSCDTYHERIDGNNGLALTPNADLLFDRGFITFADDGTLLTSSLLSEVDLGKLGISVRTNVGPFRPEQRPYLDWHRTRKFRGSV